VLALIGTSTWVQAQTKAYVTDTAANVVSVIDTSTQSVIGAIAVGAGPARIAMSRDGSRAYVTNIATPAVSVIDTAVDAVVATIPVGAGPSALAVTPDDNRLYVLTSGGVDVVDVAQGSVITTIAVPVGTTGGGGIAVTPDGTQVYVAAGFVSVIDTTTNTVVNSFVPEATSIAGIYNSANGVVISPDGTRAYIGVYTYNTVVPAGFSASGSIVLVDTGSQTIAGEVNLFSLPAQLALTPDGSRLYVGIQAFWVNTGYGMGFLPGRHVYAIDTLTNRLAAAVDLGATGPNWTEQNTPAGLAVTADRQSVYVAIHRLGVIAVLDVNTNAVATLLPVTAFPGDVAMLPAGSVATVPYALDAADDSATVSTVGGTAVANVLSNDRIGGFAVTTQHVTIEVVSWSDGLSLDAATGSVDAATGIAVGIHQLVYRICEIAAPSNCDDATVTVNVRLPYIIDAVSDAGSTTPGWTALANVLANDTLNGAPATLSNVTLSQVTSTNPGVVLNPYGSISVLSGTAPGVQTLTYRICEIASPSNCDEADVAVTVIAFAIDAVNDSGSVPRSGGVLFANVLANDTFAGSSATLARVRLSQLSSGNAGISLDAATGIVTVAANTPVGTYTLAYRICEIVTPANCDDATVTVTVLPLSISAINDSARGSSKGANTPLASVLANDSLGGSRATPSNVRLSQVSLTPANNMIRLDTSDGSVDVLGKTSSGTYSLVYQICESAMPSNCATATVTLDLSGK